MTDDRRPVIAGNWKMHHDHFAAIRTVQKLSYELGLKDYEVVDVVVCPPFTDLRSIQTVLEGDRIPIALGAQNCYWEEQGAFTGEVSPPMLAKLNVSYVIVGHSERRQLFGETDEMVSRKLRAVLMHQMTPIVCVGETLEQREAGETDDHVRGQMRAAFARVKAVEAASCVVAYEPIWAIGTGRNATPDDANQMCGLIRADLADLYDPGTAGNVRIQYGGSVKPGNIVELMAGTDVDGALVGGASLDPVDFARIVRYQA
ncbi:MAG: triose-phosphate isomerase [Acidimicrobiia bacterium]